MIVLITDPDDVTLRIERKVLGNEVAVMNGDRKYPSTRVVIVHQTVVDRSFLDRFPNLIAVIRRGVGFDKVDLEACEKRGIVVTNVPNYCTREVADTTMAMMLDLIRGVRQLEVRLRQDPRSWQSLKIPRIRRTDTLTLGVIGAGRIGSAVLERARSFGMQCIFYDPFVDQFEQASKVTSLAELLHESDLVSLHVPLNDQTRGMINKDFLEQLKPGAMLINTARGGLIEDEQLIVDALRSRRLGGAAFDVLTSEPPKESKLFEAWAKHDSETSGRLCITPHNAYFSVEAEVEARRTTAEEARRILSGKQPHHAVTNTKVAKAFSNRSTNHKQPSVEYS